jgi:predicted aldo/keto reductase-like oxidoreductase
MPTTTSRVSRRDFLAGLSATAGAVALRGRFAWSAETPAAKSPPKVRKGSDVVTLGKSGLRPTLLGVGTGTDSGREQREIGQDEFTRMIRHALDRGIRYIDTADNYKTHPFISKALEGVPRDKYFIQSKTAAREADKIPAAIDRFLKELNVEYVDSLLMHCMTRGTWPADMRRVVDAMQEAKRKEKIKAIGVSCHGWDPLSAAPDAEALDVQLVRINPFGLIMDATPEKVVPVIRKMHESGRGIIGMKIFGNTGLDSRQERLQSIKYVLGLGCVDCFTIGFTSIAQFDEAMDLIEEASGGKASAEKPV